MGSWIDATIDVPADAVNATTGTGENLGWFGTLDRKLDPRGISKEEAADPDDPGAQGLAGFFNAGIPATTSFAGQTGDVVADPAFAFLGLDDLGGGGGNQQQPGGNKQQPQGSGLNPLILAGLGLSAVYLVLEVFK